LSILQSVHVPTTAPTVPFPLVEFLPPLPTRVVEIPQPRPTLTAGTIVPLPQASPYHAHCHPPPALVTQTVPPPAHSHTFSYISASTVPHLYSDPLVLSTVTINTSASHPQMYCNLEQSIVEQVLRGPISTTTVSTSQPAAAEASALPTTATAPKQEPVAATVAPVASVVSAAPSAAASVLSSTGTTASAVPLAAP